MKIQSGINYAELISLDNLFDAWQEFLKGKRNKPDVQRFADGLVDNILQLHEDLANKTYKHGGYHCFNISDPKPRNISKAQVRDRLLHHAIYKKFYPFFDRTFVATSFSCRVNKGTHKAIECLQDEYYKLSKNSKRSCWALKCDIKKFFASINHQILIDILQSYTPDRDVIWLFANIIESFAVMPGKGLPLGNLTSQLFVNVYMNEFDHFIKHKLKAKHYIRYADDFVILSASRNQLIELIRPVELFLRNKLDLSLHPDKIVIKNFNSGIDFLGWVNYPKYRVLRTTTKKHMSKRLVENPTKATFQSYVGLLKHGNTHKIKQELLNSFWMNEGQ